MNTDDSVVKFVGLAALRPEEKDIVTDMTLRGLEKVDRHARNVQELVVHVKGPPGRSKDPDDKRHRFSVIIRLMSEHGLVEATADGFELDKLLHQSFAELLSQLEHKFRKK